MTARGVTKAVGLKELAKHLKILMEETMAVGDADNDRAVLEATGFSVAMGNAERQIKEICDAVTEDNDHNGVGEAIKRYGMAGARGACMRRGGSSRTIKTGKKRDDAFHHPSKDVHPVWASSERPGWFCQ